MNVRRVKFIIDSDFENVSLIGMSVNTICSSTSLSKIDCFNVELCVVEAVTNSIKHAYRGETGHELKVVLTLTQKNIIFDIYDSGAPMNPELLDGAHIKRPRDDAAGLHNIAEGGRGLGIMKEIMDSAAYISEKGENCLTLIKELPAETAKR